MTNDLCLPWPQEFAKMLAHEREYQKISLHLQTTKVSLTYDKK